MRYRTGIWPLFTRASAGHLMRPLATDKDDRVTVASACALGHNGPENAAQRKIA